MLRITLALEAAHELIGPPAERSLCACRRPERALRYRTSAIQVWSRYTYFEQPSEHQSSRMKWSNKRTGAASHDASSPRPFLAPGPHCRSPIAAHDG